MKQQRTESVTEPVPGGEVGAAAGPEGGVAMEVAVWNNNNSGGESRDEASSP